MTTNPDLLSLVLGLQPIGAAAADQAPPEWWGRASHALLLRTVRAYDDALATRLHSDDSAPRPFTCSTLLNFTTRRGLKADQTYSLRFTALEAGLAGLLIQAAQEGPLAPGQVVELDAIAFRVCQPEPASAQALTTISYQELSAPYLLARLTPPRQVGLHLASPTTFKTQGMHQPLPLPELVFGSLLERWNAFAPVVFPPEARRYAAECLAISRYKLASRAVPFKQGSFRIGGMGEVAYTSLNYDRYWMAIVHVLAEYARYAGVGAHTTQGLGQCWKTTPERGNRGAAISDH